MKTSNTLKSPLYLSTADLFRAAFVLFGAMVASCASPSHRAFHVTSLYAPEAAHSQPIRTSSSNAEHAYEAWGTDANLDTEAILTSRPSRQDEEAKDDTGTNPILFTNDFRIYTELQELDVDGDNSGLVQTFEYRWPVGEQSQVRTRLRGVSRSFDMEGDGSSDTTSGIGDFDVRFLTIPFSGDGWAIATGLEAFIDTASDDLLGDGKTSLGPQIFAVKFNPGLGMALFAPAYQYVFDVAGDDDRADVDKSQIDLFALWTAKDKSWWVLFDPQIVLDHESDLEFGQVELEFGQMMFGGLSSYIRPGFGVGGDRPVEWNLELGFKVIWR